MLQAETEHAQQNRKRPERPKKGGIGGDFTPGWPAGRKRNNNQVGIHNQMEKRKGKWGGGGAEKGRASS